ncbi:pilus assembly FimT family protein [Aliterella atlantica]|uniref:Methylase n=1 Tax=Aliterella atlantica CENA595 TaxID=1618023 RepID=A0A0D8ZTZ3_9CYAN|nr:prepilin-type N-terminal cleavage/methylation domain-containing protein [Aliterella atlantica]KJH72238.1 methylase [Aliterella atlantica CENA595]
MQNDFSKSSSDKGFTLIEVIVTIIIVGILSAIVAPSWLNFVEVRRLNIAQDQIYRSVREAQSQAKKEKLPWRISIREKDQIVQWAVHPASLSLEKATWNDLNNNIRIDPEPETTGQNQDGLWQTQFDYRGNVNLLKQVTLSSKNNNKAKRCVVISTLLGAVRTAKERPTANNEGKYCY